MALWYQNGVNRHEPNEPVRYVWRRPPFGILLQEHVVEKLQRSCPLGMDLLVEDRLPKGKEPTPAERQDRYEKKPESSCR